MICPSCKRKVDDDAWVCPHCDHIIDPSFLGEEGGASGGEELEPPEITKVVAWGAAADPGLDAPPDAMILGDVDISENEFSVVRGPAQQRDGRTATFLFYTSGATSRIIHPDAVPLATQGDALIPRTPYEDFLLTLVDGKRSVREIKRASGLAPQEVMITLLTLLDKGAIRIRTDAPESVSSRGGRRRRPIPSADEPVESEARRTDRPFARSRALIPEGDDELPSVSEVSSFDHEPAAPVRGRSDRGEGEQHAGDLGEARTTAPELEAPSARERSEERSEARSAGRAGGRAGRRRRDEDRPERGRARRRMIERSPSEVVEALSVPVPMDDDDGPADPASSHVPVIPADFDVGESEMVTEHGAAAPDPASRFERDLAPVVARVRSFEPDPIDDPIDIAEDEPDDTAGFGTEDSEETDGGILVRRSREADLAEVEEPVDVEGIKAVDVVEDDETDGAPIAVKVPTATTPQAGARGPRVGEPKVLPVSSARGEPASRTAEAKAEPASSRPEPKRVQAHQLGDLPNFDVEVDEEPPVPSAAVPAGPPSSPEKPISVDSVPTGTAAVFLKAAPEPPRAAPAAPPTPPPAAATPTGAAPATAPPAATLPAAVPAATATAGAPPRQPTFLPELDASFLVEVPKSVVTPMPGANREAPPVRSGGLPAPTPAERPAPVQRSEASPPPACIAEPIPAEAVKHPAREVFRDPVANLPAPVHPKPTRGTADEGGLRRTPLPSVPVRESFAKDPVPARDAPNDKAKDKDKDKEHKKELALRPQPGAREAAAAAAAPASATGARRATASADPVRTTKAQKLFEEALRDKADGNLLSARMNMKLALTFDPANEAYKSAFEELARVPALANSASVSTKQRARDLYDQATRKEEAGEVDEAIALLEKAIGESKEAAFYNRLGVLYAMKKREFDRAQKLIETAIDLAPTNTTYQHNLGKVLSMAATQDVAARGQRDGGNSKKSGLLGFLGRKK